MADVMQEAVATQPVVGQRVISTRMIVVGAVLSVVIGALLTMAAWIVFEGDDTTAPVATPKPVVKLVPYHQTTAAEIAGARAIDRPNEGGIVASKPYDTTGVKAVTKARAKSLTSSLAGTTDPDQAQALAAIEEAQNHFGIH
jgi:hypothetical protein